MLKRQFGSSREKVNFTFCIVSIYVDQEAIRLDTMRQSPPPRQHNCYPWFLEFAGHVVSTLLEIGGP
ncbi:hypothetical protein CY34DRAFT_812053 [Suillus luteus UH-Slu-Lm8-n1]|uniref:Uncharacterized protein n=1 Tax=Suillus luteus UH-Slu-Lm8-n1 TaxID=930992 RepID=A0A0D0ABU9_9AGAM|nr:hypothetical protein CY34DRAFT_812053 [Suillus luteus UH-Slu-Lm8-n1]